MSMTDAARSPQSTGRAMHPASMPTRAMRAASTLTRAMGAASTSASTPAGSLLAMSPLGLATRWCHAAAAPASCCR